MTQAAQKRGRQEEGKRDEGVDGDGLACPLGILGPLTSDPEGRK